MSVDCLALENRNSVRFLRFSIVDPFRRARSAHLRLLLLCGNLVVKLVWWAWESLLRLRPSKTAFCTLSVGVNHGRGNVEEHSATPSLLWASAWSSRVDATLGISCGLVLPSTQLFQY